MSLDADVLAVRTGVALLAGDHLACARVSGAGAHDLVDRVSPRPLFVRGGQMLHALFLDDAGTPIADVYLCCDDDGYLVIAEGLDGAGLAAYLRDRAAGLDARVDDLSRTHAFLCVDGPYAWELVAELTSPDIIGVPYLSFFHDPQFTCFRAGKTGEYGYDLLVAREQLDAVHARLLAVGERFELRAIELAAAELCGLEAGFFNVRRHVRAGLTPIELQLQWRIAADREYPGSAAIAARRAAPHGRVAMMAADGALAVDAPVELAGRRVGSVLDARFSPTRGEHVALALLDREVSHAGLDGFSCAGVAARTISAPAVNNRSLYVDPQRHSFATRATATFPPLVRPRWS
jgi:glycine cleavage system aminomethyltransferase T